MFPDRNSNKETGKVFVEPKKDLVGFDGTKASLKDFRGQPVVLVFNRGFVGYVCPYCTTYTAQISDRAADFDKYKAKVLVIYPTKDKETDKVKEFVTACKELVAEDGSDSLKVDVYLDPGLKLVRQYNLEGDLSRPSTFILDGQGIVRYAYVGNDKKDRPAVTRVLEEIKKIAEAKKPS